MRLSAKGLAEHHGFPGLQAFGRIGARRETDGKVQTQTRCYALSWLPAPEVYGHRPRPSGHPERPALAASRLVPARCRPQPQGSRPRQHRHASRRRALDRARIKRLTPHSCRHGFATMMLRNGFDVKTVAKLGGWKDAAIVLNYTNGPYSRPAATFTGR